MNWHNIFSILIRSAAVILLSVIQVSFIQSSPWPFSLLHIPLAFIIILSIFSHNRLALLTAFFSGGIMGLFSYNRFGIEMLSLYAVAVVIPYLFNNLFTNSSFLSVAVLGMTGHILHYFLSLGLTYIFFALKLFSLPVYFQFRMSLFMTQLVVNMALVSVLYGFYHTYMKKTKNLL